MRRWRLILAGFLIATGVLRAGNESEGVAKPFTVAVVSDFHMALDKLKNCFSDVMSRKIDTMVVVGDSCDGQDHEYAEIWKVLRSNPHPAHLYFTMGNHESYASYHKNGGDYDESGFPNGETSQKCRVRFNRFRNAKPDGPIYHDAWVHGCHFIFLGGERSRMDDPKNFDDAILTQKQMDWLEAKLKEGFSAKRPIFVFLHQAFPGTVSGSKNNSSIQQAKELQAMLSRYPQVVYFSGDTHWELNLPTTHFTDPSYGFHMFNTSSLRDPYNDQDEPIDKNMSEGLLVEVASGKVIVQGVDFLGHAFIQGQRYEVPIP